MRFRRGCALLMIAAGLGATSGAAGQETGAADAPTLRVQSRLVIEDVLVMDAHGNPVHGLPSSAFHILDNGKPQQVRGFEEGSSASASQPPRTPPLPMGTFTSVSTAVAPTTEVLLIDTDDIGLTDQMFALKQLQQSLAKMPPDLPVMIFSVRNGRVIPVLSSTTDRGAMARAVSEILPVQNHAVESRFQSAVDQLMTVAAFLQQTTGRKNLLWFSGEYPLVSVPVGEQSSSGLRVNFQEREHIIHQVQEALAEARISVYPVDVRGVLTSNNLVAATAAASDVAGGRNPRATSIASRPKEVEATQGADPAEQRGEMRSLAQATGGRAYMLNNLSEEIDQAFDLGKSAYMLAYSPSPYSTDQSFHTITLRVDGNYTLSYRTGYLATYTGAEDEPARERILSSGLKTKDAARSKPLEFQVRLTPHEDPQHITVGFSMALTELKQEHAQGVWSSKLLVSTYAYDAGGKVRSGKVQEVDTDLKDAQYEQALQGKKRVATRQELVVPKGAKYLLVIARDRDSQRTGSLLLQTRLLASLQAPQQTVPPPVPSAAP